MKCCNLRTSEFSNILCCGTAGGVDICQCLQYWGEGNVRGQPLTIRGLRLLKYPVCHDTLIEVKIRFPIYSGLTGYCGQ